MSRLSLDLAAAVCGVRPGTVRRWVHDGRLKRHWDGYDPDEVIAVRDSRNLHVLAARAGVKHPENVGVSVTAAP